MNYSNYIYSPMVMSQKKKTVVKSFEKQSIEPVVKTKEQEIQEAIDAADYAYIHLRMAKKSLSTAKNWGVVDIVGGGLISGLMKHCNASDAKREIKIANNALKKLSEEVKDIKEIDPVKIDDFLTFADFCFDGLVADLFVQSKLSKAKDNCNRAICEVDKLRNELRGLLENKNSTVNDKSALEKDQKKPLDKNINYQLNQPMLILLNH